ncbi:MAG: serine/threonine protein kinase [Rhodocyclaceae bacterium]|nr:serine/threonine protein kinase [Rhodocyclaceae bacterium]
MNQPAKLGKYEIRRELGQGAMGIVYEGYDPFIDRRVALKTVRPDRLDSADAEESLARFRREAQAAGRLSHPNIVAIYEFGEDAGTTYIAMEFVKGRELKEFFDRDERFPLPEVARIMGELLDALDAAHRAGVVHRDIKPSNIFLLENGSVKVGDFGIARLESSNLTQAGSVIGTPAYMSPEQFMGQTVDGRSDVFSAGVLLYQFLTGEKPFTGTFTTIMHKVLKEDPLPPSELNVQVPPRFDAVVRRALAKRPAERFASARDFRVALSAAMSGSDDDSTRPFAGADADATVATAGDQTVIRGDQTVPSARSGAAAVSDATVKSAQAARPGADATLPSQPRSTESQTSGGKAGVRAGAAVPSPKPMPVALLGIGGGILVLALAGGAYFMTRDKAPAVSQVSIPQAPPADGKKPDTPAVVALSDSGTMIISALGLADPNDARFAQDKTALAAAAREDAHRQLVEKAVALYVQPSSLKENYAVLREHLLSHSQQFIQSVLEESSPQIGKDGLMASTARAVVRVRDVQKSLNQMSRDERVDFIRNNGDPKISVAITARNAEGDPNAQAPRSPVAENLLKERIQSFGFRIWNDDIAAKNNVSADFSVDGQAKFKTMTVRLPASGLEMSRVVLTSWTVKCTDKKTGEEIYYNTLIPEKQSWASEEQALADVGRLVGEEFSKNFFLQHFNFAGQNVRLKFSGLPDREVGQSLMRELTAMRAVLSASSADLGRQEAVFDTVLSGGNLSVGELAQAGVLAPLNRKLQKSCFNVAGSSGSEVTIGFDPGCRNDAIVASLTGLPPAGLLDAAESRRAAVVQNPETRRKLNI